MFSHCTIASKVFFLYTINYAVSLSINDDSKQNINRPFVLMGYIQIHSMLFIQYKISINTKASSHNKMRFSCTHGHFGM